MYAAIEAGGTKFVCAVSNQDLNIIEKITIPTTNPTETFAKVFELFDQYDLKAIGIGSFGPIDINRESTQYGFIKSTPKTQWKNTDFKGIFEKRYQLPVGWSTDVNAAALAEYQIGAAKGMKSAVYLTVGTGIGGGAVVDGKILEGHGHPEMGHFYPRRHPDDHYQGICHYHGDCLEGLASGPAIEGRYDIAATYLAEDHAAWDIQAHYLAHAALAYTTILSPSCIILGGGVMQQEHLFEKIHKKFNDIAADYLDLPATDRYIIPTQLGSLSGIMGSLLLAVKAYEADHSF